MEKNIAGKYKSIWLETSDGTNLPSLTDDISTDILVVGGGITGLTASFELAKTGAKVILIDGGRIISDVTANTTAKITSLHGFIYSDLIRIFGFEIAKEYFRANQESLEHIRKQVKELSIDCDFEDKSFHFFSENNKSDQKLGKEYESLKSLGVPVEWDKENELPFKTKSYHLEDQAQFHPRKYLLTLAEKFRDLGGQIFENTKAYNIIPGNPNIIKTSGGKISAGKVIIATHYPFYDNHTFYTKLYPRKSYVLLLKLNGKTPQDMYYSYGSQIFTLRNFKDESGEYLILSGAAHKAGEVRDTGKYYKMLEDYARSHFDVDQIKLHWSTQDNGTPDRLPYIGETKSKNIFVGTGFGGWGMTTGVMTGHMLSQMAIGTYKGSNIFDPKRKTRKSLKYIFENTKVAAHVILDRIRIPGANIEKLSSNSGDIFRIKGKEKAVYKNSGKLHTLSPKCTHMGCLVNWNEGEKTWDCHCHGSRFSSEGKVIHGPAIFDLKETEEWDLNK